MLKKPRIVTHDAVFDERFYLDRTNRNGCFLGVNKAQQDLSQQKLRDSVVGIAGCGGIGGLLAMTLARLGVCHIKLADPDSFEASNINRQLGAGEKTLGRNKTLVVGEMVHDMVRDVKIEVFPEGIQLHTAEAFVDGCDLVFDQTDVYLIAERYTLHRAFQAHERTKCILASCVWGWGANIYKFVRGGVTLEDLFGIPSGKQLDRDDIEKLIVMQLNYLPRFPDLQGIYEWMGDVGNVPINAVTPPLSCYMLAARAALVLCDLERQPYCEPLPPVPDYYWYDSATWHSGLHRFDVVSDRFDLHPASAIKASPATARTVFRIFFPSASCFFPVLSRRRGSFNTKSLTFWKYPRGRATARRGQTAPYAAAAALVILKGEAVFHPGRGRGLQAASRTAPPTQREASRLW